MLLHLQPGRRRIRDLGNKAPPGLHHALAKHLRTPVGMALLDLGRREEQRGPGAGQVPCTAQLRHMRATNRAAIAQTAKTRMDGLPQRGIAGKVHIHTGGVGRHLVERFVRQHAVVTPEAAAERHIGGRGETHHLDAAVLRERICGAVSGFARRAGQQHHPGTGRGSAKKRVVVQKIADQPRGREQRPQQGLQVFGTGCVERVARTPQVLVIDRRQ